MSKVWEFAINPKQGALIAGCFVFAGVFLSGAGVVTGLLLAPRFQALRAERMAAPRLPSLPGPALIARKPAAVEPARPADAAVAAPASTPQPPLTTGLESAVLAPTAPNAPTAPAAPQAAAAPVADNAKPAPLPIRLAVQVGAFSIEENARNFVERLRSLGYPAAAFPSTDVGNRHWNVVRVGPYSAYEAASRTVLELSGRYRLEPVIIPLSSF